MRRARGFTLVELITTIIILGILAAIAIPRLDTQAFSAAVFHDRVLSALRYGQKMATSHRRIVCVSFPDNRTLALAIQSIPNGLCDNTVQALRVPGENAVQIFSGDPSVVFARLPDAFSFAANGTSTDQTIAIQSASSITITGATGRVF